MATTRPSTNSWAMTRRRCAERDAHGNLLLARARAAEEQVHQIRAGHEQHETGQREQQRQRVAVIRAHAADAFGRPQRGESEAAVSVKACAVAIHRKRRLEQRRRDRGDVVGRAR
jgi:hypothetical protein